MSPRLLAPAFLFVLLLSAAAHADPVVITGGTAQFVRLSSATATWSIDLAGAGLAVNGSRAVQRTPTCAPCPPGSVVSYSDTLSFNNDTSIPPRFLTLTVGGVTYGGPQFRTSASLTIQAELAQIIVPPGNPETFTIVVPFTANGSYSVIDNATFELFGTGQLTGRGTLEASIRRQGDNAYVTESLTYRFDDATATPEPTTLTLLGLGSAGAWVLRRRRGGRAVVARPFL